ncbi:MAG: sugar phosphate isomerase/epimerase family protein [Acidobacteriota bacterium]
MRSRRLFLAQSLALPFLSMRTLAARRLEKISVQLYTVRNEMAKDFDGSLRKIADLGFKQVEFAGYYNRTPQQVRGLLDSLGLESPSAHIPLQALRNDPAKAIEAARVIGHRYLICPYLEPAERKSLAQYRAHAALFNKFGEMCRQAGIQFGYHNHEFEFETLEGQLPMDLLLRETNPDLVKIELDLYWAVKAKQDPVVFLQKNPGRVIAFHVKDQDNTPRGYFTEVGRGIIDFAKIFKVGRAQGVELYIVEQDQTPGSPFDSLKISIDYLKRLEY